MSAPLKGWNNRYDTDLYLGGDLELRVPITVHFNYEAGGGDGWNEPRYSAQLVDAHPVRNDGLEWHDGCDRAFDAWWDKSGHNAAMDDLCSEWDEYRSRRRRY